jgi:hypothetical protein
MVSDEKERELIGSDSVPGALSADKNQGQLNELVTAI